MDVAAVSLSHPGPVAAPSRISEGVAAASSFGEGAGLSGAERQAVAQLRRNEALIQAQEANLRARGGDCVRSVDYVYAVGPDGKRYIAAAQVRLEGPEEALRRMGETGAASGVRVQTREEPRKDDASPSEGAPESPRKGTDSLDRKATSPYTQDPETRRAIRELERIDREVRAHEAAHRAAGGAYAGAASFGYVKGPDGRSYAVSGEVPIHAPAGETPEETLRILSQVRAAALAPGDPSGPDMAVAASAASGLAAAQAELASQGAREAYASQQAFSDRRESDEKPPISLRPEEPRELDWVA